MKKKEGVCCSCQSVHPVMPANLSHFEREELEDRGHRDEINWVMAPHKIFGDSGPWCDEGVGTMPQTVDID